MKIHLHTATRQQLRTRVTIIVPAGSGGTTDALPIATSLVAAAWSTHGSVGDRAEHAQHGDLMRLLLLTTEADPFAVEDAAEVL
jgi:hypothetical protein